MRIIKNSLLLFISLLSVSMNLNGQELKCEVNVVTAPTLTLNTVDKDVFDKLKQAVTDFMNNTTWTKDKFEVQERINCVLQLSITEIAASNTYKGSIQVNSSRPVFNSSYNSTLFNFLDEDLEFTYDRNQIIRFAPNQFSDNLTSILAFYAYMVIGYDYDSFSLEGGTTYFETAQQIVSNAQSVAASGWRANEPKKRNRFYLVDNALQELFKPLRTTYYEYHRLGLDYAYQDPAKARAIILKTLKPLLPIQQTRPASLNIQLFFSAKINELKKLFGQSDPAEKAEVIALLKKLDPANGSKYEEM